MNISPEVDQASKSNRSEADVLHLRELARAKLRAAEAYHAFCMLNTHGKTEDERIDMMLERSRLNKAWDAAIAAYNEASAK